MVSEAISHYRIIKKLGAGGMGEVYLAEDTRLNRKVAIKVVPPKFASDELARRRLIREARAAAKLDHPNICAIHEVGEEGDVSFIVMQYIEGETLAAIIRKKHLEVGESVDIATQILSALEEAHSQGVIHRDIKPQNIIVTSRGQVKVLDFGLAKTVQQDKPIHSEAETQSLLTEAGVVVGTVGYMAPEQARGAPLDARSDLFSVGALLYECLTSQPAFTGANLIDICAGVLHVDPQPPSKLNPYVPAELDKITLRALAKEAGARYQSAGELVADLRRVQENSNVEEPEQSQSLGLEPTKPRRSAFTTLSNLLHKRSPFAAAAMIVSVIAVAGFMVVPRFWRAAPHRPSAAAMHFYERGTTAIRDGAYFQASKALERAVSLDDKFALAHARLAEAWSELDYSDRAKDELLRVSALVPDRSALPEMEELYLKAITDTVTRDLVGAVESYHRIAQLVPEPEGPFAYLDLGRAYEKNEEITKAIESYQEAAKRDSQYAVAFLRLGILYGRQQDLNRANEAFDTAESLNRALSNLEGETEAVYQRGALLNKIGKVAEARVQLLKAYDMIATTGIKYQQILTLLQLSSVSYTDGHTIRAKEYASEAVEIGRANGLENLTAQGLIDLGAACYVRREYGEAERYFKQAREFAQRNRSRRNEAIALLSLGRLYIQQDLVTDEALRNVDQALGFFQEGGYKKEVSTALRLRGQAKLLKGDYNGALQELEPQLQFAEQVDDPSQLASLHALIGRTLADQEQYPDALHHFEQSYSIYDALGNKLSAGYSLLDKGDMLWRLGRYEESRKDLNQASVIGDRLDSNYKQLLLARASLFASQSALSERRLSEAKSESLRALALLGTGYKRTVVEAKYTLGLAECFSGAKREGKQFCQEALDIAPQAVDPRVLSCALLALAESMLENGDAKNALTTAIQAQKRFSDAGQQESEWRALLIAGRASVRMNEAVSARSYLSRAETQLLGIQQKWGAEAFNSYLARPDNRLRRKELSEAVAR